MATKIVTKNSSTASAVPTASDLVQGELAVNVADKRLFTEDNTGTIVELGTNPSTIDINAGSIDGTAIGASSASTGAFTTLTATGLTVDTNALYVDSTNNRVGIGTSSPAESIHTTGNIRLGDSAPAELYSNSSELRFGVDKNNDNGTSNITFYVDNSEKARIDSSGNVGIGTSSPDTLLTVAHDTADQIKIGDTTDTNFWSLRAGTNFIVKDNDVEKMRIDSSGNVGIGTTSPDTLIHLSANTGATLTLESTDTAIATNEAIGTIDFFSNDASGIGAASRGSISLIAQDAAGAGSMLFKTSNASSASTERMRIDSSGNMGIGTSSPQSDGNTTNLEVSSAFGARVLIANTDTNGRKYGFYSSNSGILGLADYTASGTPTRMAIASSGNVGIGTTSPSSELHIASASPVLTLQDTDSTEPLSTYIDFKDSGGTLHGYVGYGSSSSDLLQLANSYDAIVMYTGSSGTLSERMRIDTSGNLLVGVTTTSVTSGGFALLTGAVDYQMIGHASGVASGNYYIGFAYNGSTIGAIVQNGTTGIAYNTSSDQRLKENIADADDAGSKIDAIQVRQYDWKADGSHQDYGMIAQELVEVAPEAVTVPTDSEEMMGVDYSKLVPMLIKEIQSLRNRVAQLEE